MRKKMKIYKMDANLIKKYKKNEKNTSEIINSLDSLKTTDI